MSSLLPNFLIVGTAKAATTTIHEYLKQHHNVFMTDWKEPSFFVFKDKANPSYTTDRPVKFITEIKDYKELFSGGTDHAIRGESSTPYLYFYDKSIENIKSVCDNYKDIKILIVLRNPVDRAFSQYMMKVRDLVENLSFEDALLAEEERMENNAHFDFFYRNRGLYYNQVKAYIKEFDNVKVMMYEDFRKNEQTFLNEIVQFLGLQEIEFEKIGKQNISGRPKVKIISRLLKRNPLKQFFGLILPKKWKLKLKGFVMAKNLKREKMNKETAESLRSFYQKDIEKLEQLMGCDLSNWKN